MLLSLQSLKPKLEGKARIEREISAMANATDGIGVDPILPAVMTEVVEDFAVIEAIAFGMTFGHHIGVVAIGRHLEVAIPQSTARLIPFWIWDLGL